jgi:hypothetical protein
VARGTRPAQAAALGTGILGLALGAGACGTSVAGQPDAGAGGNGGAGGDGHTTTVTISHLTAGGVDKVDLLLMVDNSRSMADKQAILATTVPDLVRGLVNPPCVDGQGATASQPAGPLDACPAGTRRRLHPITDIHIGIITSSIGGHGSDACPETDTFSCPGGATNATNNDLGHLVSRQDPCAGGAIPTYQGKGFLAWDPAGKDTPPGEAAIGSITIDPSTGAVTTATPGLVPTLKDLVLGAGQIGCGYEASMESWYRFLVDPEPYHTISVDPSKLTATPHGVDDVLLQQRKDFLRPSSLLAIIGLTDENDCSIKEYGQFWFAAQQRDPQNPGKNFYLPRARSECATNPGDACCKSCGQDQGTCPADPNCSNGSLDAKTDDVNLRCWDQKRRFGIDFLYPIDRYTTGLTQQAVPSRTGELVPNPIFSDLDPTDDDSAVRDPSMVLLTYVVGVPWQDLARDPHDAAKGFKNAGELSTPDASGHPTWDYVLGDPANFIPPLDPHMIEATAPRQGTNPITGDALAPPTTLPGPGPDPINGHEYTPGTQNGVQTVADDLQYACVFDLPVARDCSDPNVVSCDCSDPKNDNPLCEPVTAGDPTSPRTRQVRAKGYPGIRQLALVKALGPQGIAASICPAQLSDLGAPSYGYRPAIQALLDRLTPIADGGCFPRKLQADAAGQVACGIVEARNSGQHLDAAACAGFCAGLPGRAALSASRAALRAVALADPVAKVLGVDCVCEIPELGGAPGCGTISSELGACQCDAADLPSFGGKPVDGWCYVDAAQGLGNPVLVQQCPATQQRLVRFVGAGNPTTDALVLMACAQ